MKVAFSGKGGVGKTTLAGFFVQALSGDGKEVLAVDCDPDANLGRALGFKKAGEIRPIVKMKDMIDERMGVSGDDKSFFKLNPKIDDIPDKFARSKGNIKLIVMGRVEKGGKGCMCPENTFVKNLISHIILKRGEHLVMDMEAGLEHFGRGTAAACDFVLAIVEPSKNSIATAEKIYQIAKDIGIRKIFAIGNKVRSLKDKEFIKKELKKIKMIETIDFDENFSDWDKEKPDEKPLSSDKIYRKIEKVEKFLKGELK